MQPPEIRIRLGDRKSRWCLSLKFSALDEGIASRLGLPYGWRKAWRRFVPYTITYSPRNPIVGVKPKTVCEDTAAAAWALTRAIAALFQIGVIADRAPPPAIDHPEFEPLGGRPFRTQRSWGGLRATV